MGTTIFRAAVWYLTNWRLLTVPFKLKIKPLSKWREFFGAEPTTDNLMAMWERAKGASALAAIYTSGTKAVFIDIDAYRVGVPQGTVLGWATYLSKHMVVALTPRGGLRLIFEAEDEPPHALLVLTEDGTEVGEGGYDAPHLWHLPPSYGCRDKECKDVAPYNFWVGSRAVRYPWATPWQKLPMMKFSEATEIIKKYTGYSVIPKEEKKKEKKEQKEKERKPRPVVIGDTGTIIVPPCWKNLKEFKEWLRISRTPVLPACVARALGYRVKDGKMEWTGEVVKEGERFVYGAAAVMFLAACLDEVDPDEVIDYVGENLENFPEDTGTKLDKRLSYLLEKVGGVVVPRYAGLGSIGLTITDCDECPYRHYCRAGYFGDRYVPWWPFLITYLRLYGRKWVT